MPLSLFADTYRVISIKGCIATLNDSTVREGDIIQANSKFKINKADSASTWIIKLQSTSTGKIHPLCSPSSTVSQKSNSNSESWMSWFWNNITGQKKCSTRAPENELTEGIAQNLSQTFYLLISNDHELSNDINFVTNLSNGTYFICEYKYGDSSYNFKMPIVNSHFTLSPKIFVANEFLEERTILRISVKYVSETAEIIPITDSMNIILIKEDVQSSSFQ